MWLSQVRYCAVTLNLTVEFPKSVNTFQKLHCIAYLVMNQISVCSCTLVCQREHSSWKQEIQEPIPLIFPPRSTNSDSAFRSFTINCQGQGELLKTASESYLKSSNILQCPHICAGSSRPWKVCFFVILSEKETTRPLTAPLISPGRRVIICP